MKKVVSWALCILVIAVAIWVLPVKEALSTSLFWIDQHPYSAWLVFIALYVITALLLIPVVILSIPAGAIFGFGPGVLIVWTASVLSAMLAMLAARTVLQAKAQRLLKQRRRFRALERAISRNGFVTVLLSRLSLVLPFVVMNYVFSVTAVRVRDYFLATIIGILPSKILYVYTGFVARDLAASMQTGVSFSGYGTLVLVIGLLATVVMIIIVSRAASHYLQEESK